MRAGSDATGGLAGDFERKRRQQLADLERKGIDPFADDAYPEDPGVAPAPDPEPAPEPAPPPATPPAAGVIEIDPTITLPIAMPRSQWMLVLATLHEEPATQHIAAAIHERMP